MLSLVPAGARAQEGAASATPPTVGVDAGAPQASTESLDGMLQGAIERLARQTKREALAKLAARDYPAALEGLTRALSVAPDDAEVHLGLGRLHLLLSRRDEAERHLRAAAANEPPLPGALLLLASVLSEPPTTEARLAEASALLERSRLHGASSREVALLQARVASARGEVEEAARFYSARVALGEVDDALRLELGDFHRDRGESEQALQWYQRVEGDGERARVAALRIFELQAQREAQALSLSSPTFQPTAALRRRAEQARRRVQARDLRRAAVLLDALEADAPLFALAHVVRAELALAADERGAAEVALLRAIALGDPEGDAHAALGRLYARWSPSTRHPEAAFMLRRALLQRPDRGDLQGLLAESLRAIGDLPGALAHARAAIATAPDEGVRKRAVLLVASLEDLVREQAEEDSVAGDAVSSDTDAALARARAHLARGTTDAALALLRGLPPARRDTRTFNLEARILLAAGREGEARGPLQRSLRLDASQARIQTLLGKVLLSAGDRSQAFAALARAEALGDGAATVARVMARADAPHAAPDYLRYRELSSLRDALVAPKLSGLAGAEAAARDVAAARLDRRLAQVQAGWGLLAMGVVAALFLLWWWRRGGVDLRALVEAHPETGSEVQRILLSIRHEVLKHNTTMLSGLIDGLAAGRPDGALARQLALALFGPVRAGDAAVEGASRRLFGYASQLRQLGRSRGMRVNLRARDPAFSELLAGFTELARVRGRLERLGRDGSAQDARLLRALRAADACLNRRGQAELQRLLAQLQTFVLDVEQLVEIFEGVRNEPAHAAHGIAALSVESVDGALPCALIISRHEIDDVLTNLFRNAVQSSLRADPEGEVQVGVEVLVRVDEITGLRDLVLRVLDRSSEALSPELLRNQTIERGLGLTADRVVRHDGSLDVEPLDDGPWRKAVVLTLPLSPGR